MDYHRQWCDDLFGNNQWPDTDATNNYYGGDRPAGSKIIFANGQQDPWQHAGVTETFDDMEVGVQCRAVLLLFEVERSRLLLLPLFCSVIGRIARSLRAYLLSSLRGLSCARSARTVWTWARVANLTSRI
jgi:hypothetical protein